METPIIGLPPVGFCGTKPTLKEWKPSLWVELLLIIRSTKPTLKEWKLLLTLARTHTYDVYEAYLEGMETPAACRLLPRPPQYEAYLEGMETRARTGLRPTQPCTKPTLKEWKHTRDKGLPRRLDRTKPTLKEWKLQLLLTL